MNTNSAPTDLAAFAKASWGRVAHVVEALPAELIEPEVAALMATIGRTYGYEGAELAHLMVRNARTACIADLGDAGEEAFIAIAAEQLGRSVAKLAADDLTAA
jgi:hypothetical protein